MPRSAGFTRRFGPEAELVAQRGLDAVAVEDFALDLGGLDRFVADQFDLEGLLVVRPDMPEGADELAGSQQKLPFQRLQCLGIVGEIRPVRSLPVPGHEL